MSYYEICPECGGRMYNIDKYGFSGMKCDTCYLIKRSWEMGFYRVEKKPPYRRSYYFSNVFGNQGES